MKAPSIFIAFAALSALKACTPQPPTPQPPPLPDATDAYVPPPAPTPVVSSDASLDCLSACNALLRMGCAEGAGFCPATMQKMQDDRLVADRVTHLAVTCAAVVGWKSRSDLAAHTNWTCSPLSEGGAAGSGWGY